MRKLIFIPLTHQMKNKTLLLFLLALTLVFSCTNSEKPKEEIVSLQKTDSLVAEMDTFYIGDKLFSVEQITKADFDKVPDSPRPDTSEANCLAKDANYATRLGVMLMMKVGKDNNVSFKDNPSEGYEEFAKYTYMGRFKDIGSYVILGSFVESFNYLLIDYTNGDTNYVCDVPALSPSKKYFICGNVDLIAGFVFNGFDLYGIRDKKAKLIGRRYLNKWGPQKTKWLNDSSIVVERAILDTTLSTLIRTDYIKLVMK
jgi:hypothetical protein